LDAHAIVNEAITHGVEPATKRYIQNGKLEPGDVRGFQKGIRIKLLSSFCSHREEQTLFESLAVSMPGLNREQYRLHYRNRFEYFHRQARIPFD